MKGDFNRAPSKVPGSADICSFAALLTISHTIKWTDKTSVEGGKDIGDGIKEGSKVSVKYTEKAGDKTR